MTKGSRPFSLSPLFQDRFPADRVMMETDFPHPVCLCYDRVREKVDLAFGHLSDADRHQILWKTAADLYDVPEPDRAWEPSA